MNDNSQSRLNYVTQVFINPRALPSLRGVSSQWIGDTIHLSFFFDGEITEDQREEAADAATEIMAQFSKGFLSEKFISLQPHEPLPNDPFLVYKRNEQKN